MLLNLSVFSWYLTVFPICIFQACVWTKIIRDAVENGMDGSLYGDDDIID